MENSETQTNKLTPKQKIFCKYYTQDKSLYGNGLKSYAKAYNLDLTKKQDVDTAKANAHRLLTNAYILRYIDELLESEGLNDLVVDKELLFLIKQKANFHIKFNSIKLYMERLRRRSYVKTFVKEDGSPICPH